nr:hypothetical protein [Tanacetum cinerariifolium]
HAVGTPTRQVAGAVQALAAAKGAGDETLGSETGTQVVAAREASAADVQLTRDADGLRVEAAVEDVNLQIADWGANGHRRARLVNAGPVGDVDGRLGRAVQVEQPSGRQA